MKKFAISKVFTLLLLSFSGNSYAVDTYTAINKTLKIPQVIVGDTTYNDVVLKLNDFEVLAVGTDPLVGILKDNFVMQFISAVRQAGQLHVTIRVTSVGEDRENRIAHGFNAKARLTDNKGTIYDAATVTIPRINQTYDGAHINNHLFDADTPVEIVITFDNMDPQATEISLLDLVFRQGQSYKVRNIQFEEFSF